MLSVRNTPKKAKCAPNSEIEKPTTPKSKKPEKLVTTPLSVKLERFDFNSNNPGTPFSGRTTPKLLSTRKSVKKQDAKFEPYTPKAHVEFSLELKKVINERNILTSKTKKRVFKALDDMKNNSEEESRKYKREKALLEIINSEIKYVSQLEMIINFFMNPVQERKLLKEDDFNILFGNIKTIHGVNKQLLTELDKGYHHVVTAFNKIAPFLKLYAGYAYDYKNSLQVLKNARTLNPQFAKFLESQETRPEVQNQLSALLITPIQRVPRYKLLLMQLQELTSPFEKDYDGIVDCLEKVQDAAEHINNVVEDQENMQKLLELQRCLRSGEPNVITPGRKFKRSGILMKMSTKQSHSEKLYVTLMSDIIMFNKMKKDEPKVNTLKCSSIYPLNKCKVYEILDKGCFRITCQDQEIILYHEHFSETKRWIETLNNAIQNYIEDRKTLRKESSARRPVKRKDMLEYHEIGLSPGQPLKKRKIVTVDETGHCTKENRPRLRGRRSLHTSVTPMDEIHSDSTLPSSHSAAENGIEAVDNPANSQVISELPKDVYIFGNPNNVNTGFKFTSFLGGVGTSIKRLFGFRNAT